MDQVKIGQFIAGKRKSQGMTQEQLAEKLGKSRKAVSKWERGVCLPDVSVYTELCGILGITLNEFFAGEDIEPVDVAVQSEKNLLGVAIEGSNRSGRLKKVILITAAAALILAGVLGWVMSREGYFLSNYVKVIDRSTQEGKTAEMLSDGYPLLYHFDVSNDFTSADLIAHVYKEGKETGEDIKVSNYFSKGDIRKGTIALLPLIMNDKEVRMVFSNEDSRLSADVQLDTELLADDNDDGYISSFAGQSSEIIRVRPDEEIPLGILYLSAPDYEGYFPGIAETYEDTARCLSEAGVDYALFFTVKFGKEEISE